MNKIRKMTLAGLPNDRTKVLFLVLVDFLIFLASVVVAVSWIHPNYGMGWAIATGCLGFFLVSTIVTVAGFFKSRKLQD